MPSAPSRVSFEPSPPSTEDVSLDGWLRKFTPRSLGSFTENGTSFAFTPPEHEQLPSTQEFVATAVVMSALILSKHAEKVPSGENFVNAMVRAASIQTEGLLRAAKARGGPKAEAEARARLAPAGRLAEQVATEMCEFVSAPPEALSLATMTEALAFCGVGWAQARRSGVAPAPAGGEEDAKMAKKTSRRRPRAAPKQKKAASLRQLEERVEAAQAALTSALTTKRICRPSSPAAAEAAAAVEGRSKALSSAKMALAAARRQAGLAAA